MVHFPGKFRVVEVEKLEKKSPDHLLQRIVISVLSFLMKRDNRKSVWVLHISNRKGDKIGIAAAPLLDVFEFFKHLRNNGVWIFEILCFMISTNYTFGLVRFAFGASGPFAPHLRTASARTRSNLTSWDP